MAVSPLSPRRPPGPCLLGLPVWAWKPVPDLVRTWSLLTSLLVIRQSSAWAEAPLTVPSLRPGPEGQGHCRTQQEPAMGVGRSGQWEGGETQPRGRCGRESVLRLCLVSDVHFWGVSSMGLFCASLLPAGPGEEKVGVWEEHGPSPRLRSGRGSWRGKEYALLKGEGFQERRRPRPGGVARRRTLGLFPPPKGNGLQPKA